MPTTIYWKPSPQAYPDGKHSCRILERVDTLGAIKEGHRMPVMHYDHASEDEAKT
jgi:hypothetical protein